MAEEKVEVRDINFRQVLPWTELFRGFQVALDHRKLLLAAAGIVSMALLWWVWSLVFYSATSQPKWTSHEYTDLVNRTPHEEEGVSAENGQGPSEGRHLETVQGRSPQVGHPPRRRRQQGRLRRRRRPGRLAAEV